MEFEEKSDVPEKKIASRKRENSDYIAATVYFPKEMNENLRLFAGEQGISKVSYIMNAVNEKFVRDACKDSESRSLIEIKKVNQELESLNSNIEALTTAFNLLKSSIAKVIDLR